MKNQNTDFLTLETKAKMTVGNDFWHSNLINGKRYLFTDGPHGLRKQVGNADHLGLNESQKATCFPTSSAIACSFNEELVYEVGKAIGLECIEQGVACILGPAVNIKRNPLGGRSFEYYSEDPYLAGKLASSFIKGVQSVGVAACIKHFACNNQESNRLVYDVIVDNKALYEIYLKGFEIAIKEAKPKAVMCSYNLINGTYASENKWLLKDVLRNQFGFDGIVVSDWGAVNNKIASLKAGLDLEMPASMSYVDVIDGITNNEATIDELDWCVNNLINFSQKIEKVKLDKTNDNHNLSYEACSESIVLLKNEGILPLDKEELVYLMGNVDLRIQGAGSSLVNPNYVDNIFTCLDLLKVNYKYIEVTDTETIRKANKILFFISLPSKLEIEGKDRESLKLPTEQLTILNEVLKLNNNVCVILNTGSVVELPFIEEIKGLVLTHLGGEAVNKALVDILYNKVNPSGSLAETWIKRLEDCPCEIVKTKKIIYKESIFVGYRYYDKVNLKPLFPFGFGLSYSNFDLSDIKLVNTEISFKITNTGSFKGKKTVMLFLRNINKEVVCPLKELKAFNKVELNPLETKIVKFKITKDFFEYYSNKLQEKVTYYGKYKFLIGFDALDIRLETDYILDGATYYDELSSYLNFKSVTEIKTEDFYKIYQKPIVKTNNCPKYNLNSTMLDINKKTLGKMINYFALKQIKKQSVSEEEFEIAKNTYLSGPIRIMKMGLKKTDYQLEGIVDMLNGKIIRGALKFIKRDKRLKKYNLKL